MLEYTIDNEENYKPLFLVENGKINKGTHGIYKDGIERMTILFNGKNLPSQNKFDKQVAEKTKENIENTLSLFTPEKIKLLLDNPINKLNQQTKIDSKFSTPLQDEPYSLTTEQIKQLLNNPLEKIKATTFKDELSKILQNAAYGFSEQQVNMLFESYEQSMFQNTSSIISIWLNVMFNSKIKPEGDETYKLVNKIKTLNEKYPEDNAENNEDGFIEIGKIEKKKNIKEDNISTINIIKNKKSPSGVSILIEYPCIMFRAGSSTSQLIITLPINVVCEYMLTNKGFAIGNITWKDEILGTTVGLKSNLSSDSIFISCPKSSKITLSKIIQLANSDLNEKIIKQIGEKNLGIILNSLEATISELTLSTNKNNNYDTDIEMWSKRRDSFLKVFTELKNLKKDLRQYIRAKEEEKKELEMNKNIEILLKEENNLLEEEKKDKEKDVNSENSGNKSYFGSTYNFYNFCNICKLCKDTVIEKAVALYNPYKREEKQDAAQILIDLLEGKNIQFNIITDRIYNMLYDGRLKALTERCSEFVIIPEPNENINTKNPPQM